jgi:hypothetical protein
MVASCTTAVTEQFNVASGSNAAVPAVAEQLDHSTRKHMVSQYLVVSQYLPIHYVGLLFSFCESNF